MPRARFLSGSLSLACLVAGLVGSRPARAVDLPKVAGTEPRLDVTETSIVAQHFNARTSEGEDPAENGYGTWLNRLNIALRWKRLTLGTRLDSSLYWLRPEDRSDLDPTQRANIVRDGASRYRDGIYPAKLWLTYQSPNLEVTAGDAYVQFGRGLVLSMRKIDELGVDNTVRGGKVTWNEDPFSVTLVAGLANPNRVDEVSGRALFLPRPLPGDAAGAQPLFGSDRIVGAQIEAGRGLPVVLSTHVARITRCAPFRYDASGRVIDGTFDAPFGSCDANDTRTWLASLPTGGGAALNASEILNAGQGIEIPTLWGHGKIYVEGAVQRRYHDDSPNDPTANGNALYGAASANYGPVTHTLEVKSYRNFYAAPGGVDISRAVALNNILYSTPPTAELITQDAELGFFNVCVDGGRLRTDVRTSDSFLFYGTSAYFYTRSEITGGGCSEYGDTLTSNKNPDAVHNDVFDGLGGFEWRFDSDRSHFFASAGARDDTKRTGDFYYNEFHAEYAFTKHVKGPVSFELTGRHRLRKEENQNLRGPDGGVLKEEPWREGEHYTALKIAPKWVLSQGIEYTSKLGLPTYYFNGSVLYKFTGESNIRALVGQQRGGLKCVSGVCKVFPPFEGARVELTLRF
jgi:hypothetical protein